MTIDLQVAHIGLFALLAIIFKTDRVPLSLLSLSGCFYIFANWYIWPHFMVWPNGIIMHIIKMAFDFFIIAMMLRVSWSLFVLLQSFILFLIIGLNTLAAIEFPFLKLSLIYDMYPITSHVLNVAQLVVGIGYGLHLIGLVRYVRNIFDTLVPIRDVRLNSTLEEEKCKNNRW